MTNITKEQALKMTVAKLKEELGARGLSHDGLKVRRCCDLDSSAPPSAPRIRNAGSHHPAFLFFFGPSDFCDDTRCCPRGWLRPTILAWPQRLPSRRDPGRDGATLPSDADHIHTTESLLVCIRSPTVAASLSRSVRDQIRPKTDYFSFRKKMASFLLTLRLKQV